DRPLPKPQGRAAFAGGDRPDHRPRRLVDRDPGAGGRARAQAGLDDADVRAGDAAGHPADRAAAVLLRGHGGREDRDRHGNVGAVGAGAVEARRAGAETQAPELEDPRRPWTSPPSAACSPSTAPTLSDGPLTRPMRRWS